MFAFINVGILVLIISGFVIPLLFINKIVLVTDHVTQNKLIYVAFSTTNAFSAKYPTDGIANSYTLPQTVSNDNNILVTIDGVAITPTDDYIVSGTTLTLTFMPPSDLNIEARSLR